MKIAHIIIISTSILFIIFAIDGYITLDLNQKDLQKSTEFKNEAQANTIIQNLDKSIEKQMGESTALTKTSDIQNVVIRSNEDGQQENQTVVAQDEFEGLTPFIPATNTVTYNQAFSNIVNFYKNEYNYNITSALYVTNQYGAYLTIDGQTSNYTHNEEKWWQAAKNSDVYFENIRLDKSLKKYSIPMSVEITDNKEKFLGVMKISLSLDELLHGFEADAAVLKDAGKNVILIDENGSVIYADGIKYDPTMGQIQYYDKLKEDNGFFESGDDSNGSTIVTYSKSIGYGKFVGFGWTVIITQDESSAYAEFANTRNSVIIISTIGVIGSILIGVFVSIYIARPIMKLSKMTRKLSEGDFEVNAPKSHLYEIGIIGNSFNSMAKSLKRLLETEIKLAEAHAKIKNERFTAIGELAASLAHNMKNPLATIQSSADILKRVYKGDGKDVDDVILRMNRAVDRMTRQIDDVLNFVRITPLNLENSSIIFILDSVIKTIAIPLNVKIELPKNDFQIRCDVRKLETVFTNLIINSIQAIGTKEDGKIIIRANEEGKIIVVEIEDNGSGIANELLSKLFEPLVTTKLQGTGLGLSTSKNIVEQHGGTISARNRPTVFTIKIPKEQKP
ncbi:MAG: ATP-binding protein [Nitrosotalea sp.]